MNSGPMPLFKITVWLISYTNTLYVKEIKKCYNAAGRQAYDKGCSQCKTNEAQQNMDTGFSKISVLLMDLVQVQNWLVNIVMCSQAVGHQQ